MPVTLDELTDEQLAELDIAYHETGAYYEMDFEAYVELRLEGGFGA